ncbi:MAG TPA: triple tyrosine motif-containing protein, partial [Candidatus Didemnitutus sp.]|nr:triple tyrosine motif-containing protein [Candidatus Didemnitutus sp.]
MKRYALGLLVGIAMAGGMELHSQHYTARILDVKHGLPSFDINATHVDQYGYTWIATQDGLCRWNGKRIETFMPSLDDSSSILSQRCYSITERADGTLRFSSINGISTFDKGRQAFRNWSPRGDRNSTDLKGSLLRWMNDSVAVFWRLSGTSEPPLNMVCTLGSRGVSTAYIKNPGTGNIETMTGFATMVSDVNGRLWAATSYGLAVRELADSVFVVMHSIASEDAMMPDITLIPESGSTAWLIDKHRRHLFRVNLGKKGSLSEVVLPSSFDISEQFSGVTLSENRLFLVNSHSSVCVIAPGSSGGYHTRVVDLTSVLGTAHGVTPLNGSFSCVADSKNRVWFSGMGGVVCYDLRTNVPRYVPIELPREVARDNYNVHPINIDDQDRITAYDPHIGVIIADPQRPFAIHSTYWPTAISRTAGIDEDRFMAIVGGDTPALSRINIRTGTAEAVSMGDMKMMGSLYRARDGRIWLGGYRSVLAYWPNERTAKRYVISSGSPNGELYSEIIERISESPDGRVWAFTDYGKYVLDPKTDRFVFQKPQGVFRDFIIQDAVLDFIPSRDGKTWVYGYRELGTMAPNGLVTPADLRPVNATTELLASIKYVSMIDNGRAVIVDRRGVVIVDLAKRTYERIRSPFVEVGRQPYLGAQRDHLGRLWIVASTHVELFDVKSYRFRLIPLETESGKMFIKEAFFPRVGNVIKVVMVHSDGVHVLDPHTVPAVRTDIRVMFSSLLVNDSLRALDPWLNDRDSLIVAYEDSPFTIRFSVVDPTYGEFLRYRYLLEGYDERWIETAELLEGRYQNVGPGTYRFRVQVFDVDGTWKEPREPLTLIVEPSWWQTLWLKVGSALMIGLVGFGFYRNRVRTITARNHELERQVQDRTRDLKAEQERSDGLLLNVLPEAVAHRLKNGERH